MSSHKPIFLLGTGRCGSTFWQRVLCQLEDIWIWGEHDGFLGNLAGIQCHFDVDKPLAKWSFPHNAIIDPQSVGKDQAHLFAWNNGFTPELVNDCIQKTIVEIFTAGLPAGKHRWGFKEIRYGHTDRVPEFLLNLFPESKIIVIARDPMDTVISTIKAWHYEELVKHQANQANSLIQLTSLYYSRWLRFFRHMESLSDLYPDRVWSVSLAAQSQLYPLMDFLEVTDRSTTANFSFEPINISPRPANDASVEFICSHYSSIALADMDEISRLKRVFKF